MRERIEIGKNTIPEITNSIIIGEGLNIQESGNYLLIIGDGDTFIKHQMGGWEEYYAVIKALQSAGIHIDTSSLPDYPYHTKK
jgi:hypothetical protein